MGSADIQMVLPVAGKRAGQAAPVTHVQDNLTCKHDTTYDMLSNLCTLISE